MTPCFHRTRVLVTCGSPLPGEIHVGRNIPSAVAQVPHVYIKIDSVRGYIHHGLDWHVPIPYQSPTLLHVQNVEGVAHLQQSAQQPAASCEDGHVSVERPASHYRRSSSCNDSMASGPPPMDAGASTCGGNTRSSSSRSGGSRSTYDGGWLPSCRPGASWVSGVYSGMS